MPLFPASDYIDLTKTRAAELFAGDNEAWSAIPLIGSWLAEVLQPGNEGTVQGQPYIGERVRIGRGTRIAPGAVILGPAWIGEDCFIGPGCYVRENVVLGDGVIAGNTSEFKNCIVCDRAEIPHWNYVGDSILGYKAHLGAGAILCNWRHDGGSIPVIDLDGRRVETGLPKFGAVIGDFADIGARAVLNPGSLIGRRSVLYPGTVWRGTLPADRIVKLRQEQEIVERKG